MAEKKYISLSKLSTFLDKLKSTFATKTEIDEVKDVVNNIKPITNNEIDAMCETVIYTANEVKL